MGLVNNQKAYDRYLLEQEHYGNMVVCGRPAGYYFQVRIPNFRGNYLSCVEELSFTLDGKEIDGETITMALNGKRFCLRELPELYKEYWNADDPAVLEVFLEGGLSGSHRIGALMRLRYGYSAYFGTCKVVTSRCEKTFEFTGGEKA